MTQLHRWIEQLSLDSFFLSITFSMHKLVYANNTHSDEEKNIAGKCSGAAHVWSARTAMIGVRPLAYQIRLLDGETTSRGRTAILQVHALTLPVSNPPSSHIEGGLT